MRGSGIHRQAAWTAWWRRRRWRPASPARVRRHGTLAKGVAPRIAPTPMRGGRCAGEAQVPRRWQPQGERAGARHHAGLRQGPPTRTASEPKDRASWSRATQKAVQVVCCADRANFDRRSRGTNESRTPDRVWGGKKVQRGQKTQRAETPCPCEERVQAAPEGEEGLREPREASMCKASGA